MEQHSFSDFSYAVNKTSEKKGYKEILVCYIYNGVEVLRKIYIPEKEGTSYVFEAKKIIDQEMKSGVLASYSYKFVKRKERSGGKFNKKWIFITAGIGLAVAVGGTIGGYFIGKNAGALLPNECTVTFAGSRYNKAGKIETIKRGSTFECNDLRPTDANTYLNVHSISMGGSVLTNEVDYTFDLDTYALSITKPTSGNIVITISGDSERIVVAEPNYKIDDDGHAIVTGFKNSKKGAITDVNIPSTYVDEGGVEHEVTEISPKILNGCSNLKRLVVPFIGLNKVANVDSTFTHTMGSLFGITSFDKAYRAEQIYFEDTATDAEWIEFYIPWSLEKISITNATSIPRGAFSGFTYVKEINISSGTESNDFTHIGNCAFYKCANLTELTYPQTTVIEKLAFKGCSSLSHFDLDGVLEIDANAFENCSGFSTLVVPSSVVEIQAGAFSGSIGGMIATDAAKDNDDWEAGWCTAPIVYSAQLEEDGSLKTYLDSTSNWRYIIVGDDLDGGNDLAYSAYIVRFEGTLANDGSITIPNEISSQENASSYTVRHLGSYVFNYNNHLKKIIFGTSNESGILSIGNNCFEGCTNLASVEGPGLAKIKKIGNYAFSGCSSLVIEDQYEASATADNATFKSLEQIGDFAFAGCPSLKSFNLPVIKNFGQYSFYNCSSLVGMKIYGDLKSLGEAMFYYDSSFKTINLYTDGASIYNEDYYVDIPNLCFCRSGYCAGETMKVSSWIKNIGYAAFAHCSFTDIEFTTHQESGVDVRKLETIGQEAFYGCNGLVNITVPAGIKTFGSGVFGECKNLLSLTINSELTNIPQEFCYYCSKLQTFKFKGEIESIGSSAFMYDQSLVTIKNGDSEDGYLPATLNSIGDAAFLNCSSISSLTLCYEDGKSDKGLKFGAAVFGGWATKTVKANYQALLSYEYDKDDSNFLRIEKGWLSGTYVQAGVNTTKFGWTLHSTSIYVGIFGSELYLAMEKYTCDSVGNNKLSIHIVD